MCLFVEQKNKKNTLIKGWSLSFEIENESEDIYMRLIKRDT
jgi:hypothetical protein